MIVIAWLAAIGTVAGCALAVYLGRDDGGGAPGALKNTPLENIALIAVAIVAILVAAGLTWWLTRERGTS